MSCVSTHFVGEKVKALCFIKGARAPEEHEQLDILPLVAAGGWDCEVNHVSLHLPTIPSRDEAALRREFGQQPEARACELTQVADAPHRGDVNALEFVATRADANLLFTASSSGSVLCYRVSDTSTANTMRDDAAIASSLTPFHIPHWTRVFPHASAVTCLDASARTETLVAASATGDVAWLRLDDVQHDAKRPTTICNTSASKLAIHGVKILGRDSIAATVGSAPGAQLRIWDIASNDTFPVLTASDSHVGAILTSIATHPTQPEVLITGADDGRVCFWDQRRLDAPVRTEASIHQRAVRALKLHSAAPQFLYSASDDATVRSWNVDAGGLNGFGAAPTAQCLTHSFLPWQAIDVHAESDTLVAGSDAQSILVVQRVSALAS